MSEIRFRETPVEGILDLRARELRAGKPLESARFAEDHDPDTMHFAACAGDLVIGCLTLIKTEAGATPSWQLRGMATDRNWQHKGVGKGLLLFAEDRLRAFVTALPETDGARIWCNARTTAAPFYSRLGYRTISDEFLIDKIGPHYKMEKQIL
jgi:GNAT superfamily N-acetyltransferase